MRDIPFNVSARTARLIGRENVSSAEGALIELVKNCYDADAKNCVVYFDDHYVDFPAVLSNESLAKLCDILKGYDVVELYGQCAETGMLKFLSDVYYEKYNEKERIVIEKKLSSSVGIYIIDDGDGMEEKVIETSWMTIGTDNKSLNIVSDNGRIRSGAKGIGRFALDRLGEECDLCTKTIESNASLQWKVNWGDFDAEGLTIDLVNAKIGKSAISLADSVAKVLSETDCSEIFEAGLVKGTKIGILQVRDHWGRPNIDKLYQELESLVPPVDAGDFRLFVISRRNVGEFGRVEPRVCDDFDYKLTACMDGGGNINFTIIRKEMDINKIRPGFLERSLFKAEKYQHNRLFGKEYKYSKSLYQLIPGLEEKNSEAHKEIGEFNLVLYFLKRQSDTVDAGIYMQRSVDNNSRKHWLDNNNGIRIYRDNFRVRPYGDIGKASWDWLGLGRRQSENPAAPRTGKWRVSPRNISGAINISRVNNIGLEDKSSREGIQENEAFSLFCNVVENLIKEFELDRGKIFKEAYQDYRERQDSPSDEQFNQKSEADAEVIAQKIFEELKKDSSKDEASEEGGDSNEKKLALALLKEKARAREIDDRLEEMKKENSLLRVFASSGITIASFTHELDSLNAKLGGRFDQLEKLIREYADLDFLTRNNLQEHKDPFVRIKILKRDDERVKNWIKYSLRTIRKDKRKRVKINIKSYLEGLRDEWNSTLIERQVDLKVSVESSDLSIRAYEIDLDCIFNNLIINSADAFKRPGYAGIREIKIIAYVVDGKLGFSYQDTGPGLAVSIMDPSDIFKPTFTTKINSAGEEVGTGLGMWLVEKTLEEYCGSAEIVLGGGFSLKMEMQM